jgi:large subunit ribosomal protein L29
MKAAELRDLGSDELQQRVREMEDQLFKLRMQKAMGQLEAAYKVSSVRRDLARIKTILREKQG